MTTHPPKRKEKGENRERRQMQGKRTKMGEGKRSKRKKTQERRKNVAYLVIQLVNNIFTSMFVERMYVSIGIP